MRTKHNFNIKKSKDKKLSIKLKKDPSFQLEIKNKCIDFIKLLGYDLKKEAIYASIDRSTFENIQWKETQQYTRDILKYNIRTKKCELGCETFFIEDKILQHSFPLELLNKRKFKNKHFYTKDKDDQTLYNMSYYNNSICGLYLKEKSNILCIDIDNHNSEGSLYTYQVMTTFIDYMKCDPIYMEVSNIGGFHLFFKLNEEKTQYEKKQLVQEFNDKYSYSVEVPIKLRLPNSIDYTPIDKYGEVYSYISAIDIVIEKCKSIKSKRLKITQQNVKEELPAKKVKSSIYCRTFTQIKKIKVHEYIQNPTVEISTGDRVLPMLKIIRIGKKNDWSIDDICSAIYASNNKMFPSKDLSKWSYRALYSQVESTYNRCNLKTIKTFDSDKPEQFISNIKYIPNDILSKIDKKFIKTIIKQIHNKTNEYKITSKNIKSFSIIFKEMIGSIYYNCKNNKSIKASYYKNHLIGMQYSMDFINLLEEYYKDELKNVDTWGIANSILKHSNFFKQFKVNKRGWYYNPERMENNFCRQFDLYSNYDHTLLNNKEEVSFIIYNSINNYNTDYNTNHNINYLSNIVTVYTEYFSSLKEYYSFVFDIDRLKLCNSC